MCESKRRKNYISSHLCIFKNVQVGSKHMGEAQKWETGLPEAQMQMAKKRKQLYFFQVTLKKKRTGCVQADAEGSDVGGSDVGHWDVRDSR